MDGSIKVVPPPYKLLNMTEDHKKKISDSHKAKGLLHWTKRPEVKLKMRLAKLGRKRKPFSERTLKKMSESRLGKWREHESWNWKGNTIKYGTLHKWKKKHSGNPSECESCGLKGCYIKNKDGKKWWTIEWSNKSETYKRDLEDWEGLCVPCHRKKDAIRRKLKGNVTQ